MPDVKSGWGLCVIIVLWQAIGFGHFMLGPYSELTAIEAGSLPEERFGYSKDFLLSWLGKIKSEGRVNYQNFQIADSLFAAITCLVLVVGIRFTNNRLFKETRRVWWISILPFAVLALELLENILLFSNSKEFPAIFATEFASSITKLKMVLAIGTLLYFFVSVLVILVRNSIGYFRHNRPNAN